MEDPEPGLPPGRPVALDDRVLLWNGGSVILGGAPWGVLRVAPPARRFLQRLAEAGVAGVVPSAGAERALANRLSARGIVHPVPALAGDVADLDVIVPAFERPHVLETCLASLRATVPRARLIVVDDASTDDDVGRVAHTHGALVIRHQMNRGPAAARNTGLRQATAPIVAFIDADCAVTPGWIEPLAAHFDDPRVVAVAPRVGSHRTSQAALARYQDAHGVLDMGPRPELVAAGAPLGYLPSAALLIRRSAVEGNAFDEDLRLGEDVDLIWRLAEAGGIVRYEPSSVVTHEMRPDLRSWARQVFDYGTSAAALDERHPRRLAPARLAAENLLFAAALLVRRPSAPVRAVAALAVAGWAVTLVRRSLRASSVDSAVAPLIAGKRLVSDAAAAGHLLRREWWPLGWLAVGHVRTSRWAQGAAASMLVPVVSEWRKRRPPMALATYVLLRLVEDAAYGSGVITGAIRSRRPGVLLPMVRLPRRPKTP
jgi:mycofactocin system glycosyltransferase